MIALGAALFQIVYFAGFTVDDAYISFRYAENFADGAGLVFNRGEYVEGYTNFLWVVLLAGLDKLGFTPQISARVVGSVCSLVTLWITFLLSRGIATVSVSNSSGKFSRYVHVAAPLFLSVSPAFGLWAGAGLETPLFGCLLMLAVWRHLQEEATETFPASAMLFGLLALVRPEGVMYFGLTCLSALVERLQKHRRRILDLWKPCALFLPIVVGHFLWRWSYYGDILPNTYYMKVGDGFHLSGVKYVVEFFSRYGGVPFFLTALLLLLIFRFQEYWFRYILLLFGVSVVYFLYVGGDWMPEFRFFAPLLPLYFLCIQEGLRTLALWLPSRSSWHIIWGVGIVACSILCTLTYLLYTFPRIDTKVDGHVVIGKLLQEQASPRDILAAIDIGAMAYFSNLRTIDYFGLVDAHIAHLDLQPYTFDPGFWGRRTIRLKADMDYVLAQEPTFIELNTLNVPTSVEDTRAADPYSDLMLRHPRFRAAYTPFYHAGDTTLFKRTATTPTP